MIEETNNQKPNEEQKPLGVLFGVLAYNTEKEFEEYIERLNSKSVHDVLITIHSALRYAQSAGIFSVEESEAVSITLRKMKDVIVAEKP
jgi:CHAD domain-containing protein